MGHVRVASLQTLVDKGRAQLVPESLAGLVTTEALLDLVDDENRDLAEALDPTEPATCTFGMTPTDPPVWGGACAFVLKGGAKALLPAIGDEYSTAEPGSHVAHFVRPPDPDDEDETDPVHVYLDDFENYVVISDSDDAFGTLAHVAAALTQRPGRDFEFVLYPDQLVERLGPKILEEMQAAADGRTNPADLRKRLSEDVGDALEGVPGFDPDDTAELDASLSELDETTPEDAKKMIPLAEALLDVGSQIHEAGMGINLEPAGLVLSAWYRTADDAPAQRSLLRGAKLTPANFANVPRSSVLIRGSVPTTYSPFAEIDPELLDELGLGEGLTTRLVAIVVEALAKDRSDPTLATDLERFIADQSAVLEGGSTWALFGDGQGGPAGLMLEFPLAEGASATALWAQAAERFPPERLLGPEGAKDFRWTLQRRAAKLGQTPVDRWKLRRNRKTRSKAARKTSDDDDTKTDIDIDIDTFERGGAVTLLMTRAGEPALSLLAQDAPTSPDGVTTVFARSDHVLSLWALDVRSLRELLLTVDRPDEEDRKYLEKDVGKNFADLYGVTHLTKHGGAMELVVSQQLMDQFRALADSGG